MSMWVAFGAMGLECACIGREGSLTWYICLRSVGGEGGKESGRAETAQGRRENRITKAAGQGGSGA